MLETLGIVDACFTSPRARIKATRKLGTKSVLEWIIRRMTDCEKLNGVIVVTNNAEENRLVQELTPLDVPVFVSHRPDVLGSLAAALEEYSCRAIVRMSAQRPFVDPSLVDRLVCWSRANPDFDYVGYASPNGRPAVLSPIGLFAEWFRTDTIRLAARKAKSQADRDHPTQYVCSHPERFRIRLLQAPAGLDREDVRLTVDIEEDWENALAIFEALGPEELDWQRIAHLLDHQPAMRKRMAALNRVYASH
ncbi:MAG: cytidylyltransferase domain-containing protein [Thermoguttaceae bacterium]